MSPYVNEQMSSYADVILPITPFTETAGSFINFEGTWQKFNGVTKPLGDSKPAWKVLRVLANALSVDGFEQNSIEDVRKELIALNDIAGYLNNSMDISKMVIKKPDLSNLIRIGLQSMYNVDSITRRAKSLQETKQAKIPTLMISSGLADSLKINALSNIQAKQLGFGRKFDIAISDTLPNTVVMLAVNNDTCGFGGRFEVIELNT
jgi:NADH-quinone oxidoreductase subunit G